MRWYQTDSDWPTDPRIEDIVARVEADPGAEAPKRGWVRITVHGVLSDLWALTAQQKDARAPGYCEKREGQPISVAAMARFCAVPAGFIGVVLGAAAAEGHIDAGHWGQGLVFFPGMARRADTYTQRKLHRQRTLAEDSAKDVRTVAEQLPNIPVDVKVNGKRSRSAKTTKKDQDQDLLPNAGPDQVDAVVALWNTCMVAPIPKVDPKHLSRDRRRAIEAALVERANLADWRAVLVWLNGQWWAKRPGFLADGRKNPAYTGNHATWVATLDWLLRPGKLQKLWEDMTAERAAPAAGAEKPRKYAGLSYATTTPNPSNGRRDDGPGPADRADPPGDGGGAAVGAPDGRRPVPAV